MRCGDEEVTMNYQSEEIELTTSNMQRSYGQARNRII